MVKLCRKRMITVGVLLTLAILSITGVMKGLQEKVILPPAENYVEASQEKALTAFIAISAVKAMVAVVEGSDVVGIQVGDVVQPLYDSVDIAWKMITASLGALYAMEVLLILCGTMGRFFLSILFIILIALQFSRKDWLRRSADLTGILAFCFYIAIPVTLAISGTLSEGYSKSTREAFQRRLEEFQEDFGARVEELKTGGPGDFVRISGGGLTSLPDVSFPKYELVKAILEDMGDIVRELPDLLIKTGVTWLLDVIVVPLGLLFLLYKLGILFIQSAFGDSRTYRLNSTLRKYLEPTRPD